MNNTYFLILTLLLLKCSETRLISMFGLINQHTFTKTQSNDTLANQINSLLDTETKGMSLHIEMGNILRLKYIDTDNDNKEYVNFTQVKNFYKKVQIYSANSPEALQSALGEAKGLFPDIEHKMIKIDQHGENKEIKEEINASNQNANSNGNITMIKYFSKKLDVVLNSEKCLKLTNSTNLTNIVIQDNDFAKILSLKAIFPHNFISYCNNTNIASCNDDSIFKNLKFIDSLYELTKLVKDLNIDVKVSGNKIKNNFKPKSYKIPDEIFNILLKYHLLFIYLNNTDIKTQKQIATPLFRFVNGYLENTKSKQCSHNINNTNSNSTSDNSLTFLESPSFLQLKNFKPVDILRLIINDTKCKKIILMISDSKNLVTFIKALFYYEEVMNLLKENKVSIDSYDIKLLKLFDPQSANSFVFQAHQYEGDDKIYVRIFYNLEEICDLPVKLKIAYQMNKGISMDDLVTHLNENSDSKIKYKDQCY